jgi:hypothetical protein
MFTYCKFCNIFGKFYIATVVQKDLKMSIIESKKGNCGRNY